MRKLIILAASVIALAVPTAALASVAVDANGVGSVGKGDVQSALGLNDAGVQDLFKKDGIKFTFGGTTTFVSDYEMYCLAGGTGHRIITNTSTAKVVAVANTNKAGKPTSGWDLTAKGYDRTSSMVDVGCEGSVLYMNTGVTTAKTTTTGGEGLYVNGHALPNTPVLPAV